VRIDRQLVQRVEWTAAELAVRQVGAFARLKPSTGAASQPFDGGALVAFGPGRYVNRAMGLGLGEASPAATVQSLVEFYAARALPPSLELCPWVDDAFLTELAGAGFRVERFRSVFVHDLGAVPVVDRADIRPLSPATEHDRKTILADGAVAGSEARSVSDEYCDAAALVPGAHDFVAMVNGAAAACGSLNVVDTDRGNGGYIGGATTLPAYRGLGLQSALVVHRLGLARSAGCEFVVATALPQGQSARNLERLGFVQLYTQAVMTRPI
jgi:GNAT superfamily N-acetyltransferase